MSIPNGCLLGGRNRFAVLAKLQAEGMLRGAPDLVLVDRAPRCGSPVAIEVKRVGGRLSPAQRAVCDRMRAAGWQVVVAYGADDGLRKLRQLGYGVAG